MNAHQLSSSIWSAVLGLLPSLVVWTYSPPPLPPPHHLHSPGQFQNKFYALGHGDSVKFEPFSFALLKEAEAEAAA